MEYPKGPPRRQYARYACQLPARIVYGSGKAISGTILNISRGGALLSVRNALEDSPFQLEFAWNGKTVALTAHIAHSTGNDRKDSRICYYGLSFDKDSKSGSKLSIIVDQLRGSANNEPDMKRDYWKI